MAAGWLQPVCPCERQDGRGRGEECAPGKQESPRRHPDPDFCISKRAPRLPGRPGECTRGFQASVVRGGEALVLPGKDTDSRRDTGQEEVGGEGEQCPERSEDPGQAGVLFMLWGQNCLRMEGCKPVRRSAWVNHRRGKGHGGQTGRIRAEGAHEASESWHFQRGAWEREE